MSRGWVNFVKLKMTSFPSKQDDHKNKNSYIKFLTFLKIIFHQEKTCPFQPSIATCPLQLMVRTWLLSVLLVANLRELLTYNC